MPTWPDGVGRVILPETDSTNAEAARRAAAGARGPMWVLAHRQLAARGRRGRAWVAPEGNFAASLLMPVTDPASAALRSFTAALALDEALAALTGRAELLALKWPNDVLLRGRKLAGILLETAAGGRALIVGIGVNLVACPPAEALEPGALAPAALWPETGVRATPGDLLDVLAPAFARWEGVLAADGFAPVRAAWLARAARLGERLTARLPGEVVAGVFETVDAAGALVLHTSTGRRTIYAAEIQFT